MDADTPHEKLLDFLHLWEALVLFAQARNLLFEKLLDLAFLGTIGELKVLVKLLRDVFCLCLGEAEDNAWQKTLLLYSVYGFGELLEIP